MAPRIQNNIRKLREERGLTQAQLAVSAEVTANYIWMLEKGRRRLPSDEVIGRLARALGVDSSKLFTIGVEANSA